MSSAFSRATWLGCTPRSSASARMAAGSVKSAVRLVFLEKAQRISSMSLDAFALEQRTDVPIDAEPRQTLQNHLGMFIAGSRTIRVFDAQDEDPSLLSCEEPIEECRAGAPNMQISCWRRSKADT